MGARDSMCGIYEGVSFIYLGLIGIFFVSALIIFSPNGVLIEN